MFSTYPNIAEVGYILGYIAAIYHSRKHYGTAVLAMNTVVVRAPEIAALLHVHVDTVRRWERRGIFPPPRQFGPHLVGWLATDVHDWMLTRPVRVRRAAP